MTRIYLIRHGQTKWNYEHKTQGSIDVELSEQGILQAKALAKRMKHYPIDHIFSSDLDRAYQTARMIANETKIPVQKIPQLKEMSFGKWEGLTNDEIQKDFMDTYTIWRNEPHKALIPEGEKLIDVQKRALASIHQIVNQYEGQNIVVVSHGATIRTILLGILEMDLAHFYRIKQDNTCMNIIEYKHYGPVVVSLNDTNHLESISTK